MGKKDCPICHGGKAKVFDMIQNQEVVCPVCRGTGQTDKSFHIESKGEGSEIVFEGLDLTQDVREEEEELDSWQQDPDWWKA